MRYKINDLGNKRFELLVQALSREIIGPGVMIYGDGPDGGREATFEGCAGYPNVLGGWDGYWVIQAKFKGSNDQKIKDVDWLKSQMTLELSKYESRQQPVRKPDNLLFFTNIILTPVAQTGGRDKMSAFVETLKSDYGIRNIAIIGYDDIVTFLDQYKNIRTSFIELILTEDAFMKLAGGIVAEKDKEYPKILPQDANGVVVKEPLHPALQKIVARYKEIPKDSFELLEFNYLELLIYKSVHEDADEDIIEHAFMMLQLPITKLGLNAIEMNTFGNGFRKSMIENLKRISRFETFSVNCLLCWLFVNAELKKRNLNSIDICRLYIEIIEVNEIDRGYQELALMYLLDVLKSAPELKEGLVFPDIFAHEERNPASIGDELVKKFFSQEFKTAQDQITAIWQLVKVDYRLRIVDSVNRHMSSEQLDFKTIAPYLEGILNEPDPEVISKAFSMLGETMRKPKPVKKRQPALTDSQVEFIRNFDCWSNNDLETIYSCYERVSGIDLEQNAHFAELVIPLTVDSLDAIMEKLGKPFVKRFLLEISLSLSVGGLYSLQAIEYIWRKFDMELFLLDERFPDVLFCEKQCILFPGNIISLLCDADSAFTVADSDKINPRILYKIKHLLVQINRQDLVEQLKKVVEAYSEESVRMQLFLAYLNGEMTDGDFENWLHN